MGCKVKELRFGLHKCRTPDFTGLEPGDLEIEMQYTNGNSIMYSVTFDLTVNEDGTIGENHVDGDVDEAMTS